MSAPESAAVTPGQAAYEAFRAWYAADVLDRSMTDQFNESKYDAMRHAFLAGAAARQPQAALATVDLHRWYAVIHQPNGMTKVIGHTSDGLGYYDSVDEWEAKNS